MLVTCNVRLKLADYYFNGILQALHVLVQYIYLALIIILHVHVCACKLRMCTCT